MCFFYKEGKITGCFLQIVLLISLNDCLHFQESKRSAFPNVSIELVVRVCQFMADHLSFVLYLITQQNKAKRNRKKRLLIPQQSSTEPWEGLTVRKNLRRSCPCRAKCFFADEFSYYSTCKQKYVWQSQKQQERLWKAQQVKTRICVRVLGTSPEQQWPCIFTCWVGGLSCFSLSRSCRKWVLVLNATCNTTYSLKFPAQLVY